MKPYDRINRKTVANTLLILLALLLFTLAFSRPLYAIGNWFYGIRDHIAFAFCNPTLWVLGLDDVMWKLPKDLPNREEGIVALLSFVSVIVHILVIIFTPAVFVDFWKRINKKT